MKKLKTLPYNKKESNRKKDSLPEEVSYYNDKLDEIVQNENTNDAASEIVDLINL